MAVPSCESSIKNTKASYSDQVAQDLAELLLQAAELFRYCVYC